jgi:hypothetical protein
MNCPGLQGTGRQGVGSVAVGNGKAQESLSTGNLPVTIDHRETAGKASATSFEHFD